MESGGMVEVIEKMEREIRNWEEGNEEDKERIKKVKLKVERWKGRNILKYKLF